ncbi:NADH:flavin oxidoreductase [Tepidibacter hydrothermalis]|uniref:NADH:flavin oxidoreductase n=1 Tax=Tepidibacter hydrothermalis TaxID=3036126 RepID=A0ABY8EFU1_9FIRM|nr:NADH:flavin oxidoreductase [Tepidibacter hydrothermalis]WFD11807.1 NADH:flavin oxidoreductase [Tepidibacter hydrothermalis]
MKSLYEKTLLGGIEVRNRFVRSATHEGLSPDGVVTSDIINLYKELALQEVGLIITSGLEVTEEKVFSNSMRINEGICIEPLRQITDSVHEAGGKIVAQLLHGGTFIFAKPDYQPQGPSPIQDRFSQITAKEMTKEDINNIVARFADASYRAKQAQFDGVQIQASFGFLLNKFISPYYNKRQDEYGGTIENRSRFIVQIRKAIAARCGIDFPVFIKLSIDDLMKDDVVGLDYKEGKEITKHLAASGYNAIEMTVGNFGEIPLTSQFNGGEPYFKDQFIELANEVDIPLIAVGGIRTENAADELLNSNSIEAISFSRPFIADMDLVGRFKNGKPSRCTTCFQCNGPNGIRCIKNA